MVQRVLSLYNLSRQINNMVATEKSHLKFIAENQQKPYSQKRDTGYYSSIRYGRCKVKARRSQMNKSWLPLPDSRQQLRAQLCSDLYHKSEPLKKIEQQQQPRNEFTRKGITT